MPKELKNLKGKNPKLSQAFLGAIDDILQRNLGVCTMEFKKVIEKRAYVRFWGELIGLGLEK